MLSEPPSSNNYGLTDDVFVVTFKEYPASVRFKDAYGSSRHRVKLAYPYAVQSNCPTHYSNKEKYNYIVNSVLDGCNEYQLSNIKELITNNLY